MAFLLQHSEIKWKEDFLKCGERQCHADWNQCSANERFWHFDIFL